jgi:hypothetical protein
MKLKTVVLMANAIKKFSDMKAASGKETSTRKPLSRKSSIALMQEAQALIQNTNSELYENRRPSLESIRRSAAPIQISKTIINDLNLAAKTQTTQTRQINNSNTCESPELNTGPLNRPVTPAANLPSPNAANKSPSLSPLFKQQQQQTKQNTSPQSSKFFPQSANPQQENAKVISNSTSPNFNENQTTDLSTKTAPAAESFFIPIDRMQNIKSTAKSDLPELLTSQLCNNNEITAAKSPKASPRSSIEMDQKPKVYPQTLDEWRRKRSLQRMSSSGGTTTSNENEEASPHKSNEVVETVEISKKLSRESRALSFNPKIAELKKNPKQNETDTKPTVKTNQNQLVDLNRLLEKNKTARQKTNMLLKRANSLFDDPSLAAADTPPTTDDVDKKRRLPEPDKLVSEETRRTSKKSKASANKGRSHSNDITLNTKDLSNFIKQQECVDDKDELLTDLAKVILIEHKRSLQLTHTITMEESSVSCTPHDSITDSRRDSFSSRQDSSISVTENDPARSSISTAGCSAAGAGGGGDSRRKVFKSSEEWHKRRKELMRKTKKWSNAVDDVNEMQSKESDMTNSSNMTFDSQADGATDGSMASNLDVIEVNYVTTQRGSHSHCHYKSASMSVEEEINLGGQSRESTSSPKSKPLVESIDNSDFCENVTPRQMIYHQSTINFNFIEATKQFAIKSPLLINQANNQVSASFDNEYNSPLSRRPTRKLPQVPSNSA